MKEGQKQIYYVSGASKAAASSSPVLDRLKSQGFEVLFALDQIDEIALQGVGTFEEMEVRSRSRSRSQPHAETRSATRRSPNALQPHALRYSRVATLTCRHPHASPPWP